ncbi:MAG: MgtC/SapB family protein [Gaiellaceae bacterium MAG52_C11]|nr:MgtC/SapB family protein [Candidatus Gaiellasilicea maunaloa]
MPSELDLIFRLSVAGLFAGLVGIERELSDKGAGFRTHILVGLGSCLFALMSAYGLELFLEGPPGQRYGDPTRIAAQIVSGIGFLGAGAIIREGVTVRGLTTAASLWVVAAIGMAAAFGHYGLAGFTTVITLLSLVALRRVKPRYLARMRSDHTAFALDVDGTFDVGELALIVIELGASIDRLAVAGRGDEAPGDRRIEVELELPLAGGAQIMAAVVRLPGLRDLDATPASSERER